MNPTYDFTGKVALVTGASRTGIKCSASGWNGGGGPLSAAALARRAIQHTVRISATATAAAVASAPASTTQAQRALLPFTPSRMREMHLHTRVPVPPADGHRPSRSLRVHGRYVEDRRDGFV